MTAETPVRHERLRAILAGQSRPLGGQVQFLGLDEVKEALGARWEQKKEFIRTLCQRIIKPHIGNTDICIEYGELGFVVLFGELDDEKATIKCGLIKAEIIRQLRGDDELRNIGVRTTVGDLASGTLRATDIGDLLNKVVNQQTNSADQQGTRSTSASVFGAASGDASANHTEQQRKNLQQAQWASIKSNLHPNTDTFNYLAEEDSSNLGDIDFGFLPLVNVKTGIISTFHCAAVRLDAFDRIINGHDVLSENADERATVELDQLTLARAKIGLMDMSMRKRIALVSVPVSYVTLSRSKARQDFIHGLTSIPPELRHYLVLTLTGLPEGVPTSTLASHVNILKKYARGIAARAIPSTTNLGVLKDAGIQIAGFKFPETMPISDAMFDTLRSFKKAADKSGLHTSVRNLRRKDLVRAAIDLEYNYCSGPVIASISDYVGPVREIDLSAF